MSARGGHPGLSVGDLLSGLGAVVLLVSLWRPWYELRIPDEMIAQARAFSSRLGELGPFAQQGLDQLQAQGAVPVTAWQVFDQADAVLAAAAGVVLGLVLLNAVGALAARQDAILVLSGLVATALVGFRLVSPPGPEVPLAPELLHPATGAHMALAGALLIVGGGLVAAMGRTAPDPDPEPPPPLQAHQVKIWNAS